MTILQTNCLQCNSLSDNATLDHGVCPSCKASRLVGDVKATAEHWISSNALFVDTETTGLGETDQAIEIAVIHRNGSVLYQSLIKPTVAINPAAEAVHGISAKELANAPTWAEIHKEVCALVAGRQLISHNTDFDQRIIKQTCDAYGLSNIQPAGWGCTMSLLLTKTDGKWPRLAKAMEIAGAIEPNIGAAHRAAFDAECCRRIVLGLAK